MLAQQRFHAHLAPGLGTDVAHWPFRGRSMYTRQDIPPGWGGCRIRT
jgi:hypothetical protein